MQFYETKYVYVLMLQIEFKIKITYFFFTKFTIHDIIIKFILKF